DPAIDLFIGCRSNVGAAANFFTGALDDVRFLSRVLTPAEVLALYNNGNGTEDDSGSYEFDVTGDSYFSGAIHCANLLQLSDPRHKVFEPLPDLTKDWSAVSTAVSAYQLKEDSKAGRLIGPDASKLPTWAVHDIGGTWYINPNAIISAAVKQIDKQAAQLSALQAEVTAQAALISSLDARLKALESTKVEPIK
ncbi:MAG: LamG domain-containing protein, partial [Dehalococcoidia bacterium]|nr:LamG domain-containing protein [Dehalococcoidia bacterium]